MRISRCISPFHIFIIRYLRAKKALEHYFTDIEITGIPVESNVSEQPVNAQTSPA